MKYKRVYIALVIIAVACGILYVFIINKKYVNSQYAFEFKYPVTWKLVDYTPPRTSLQEGDYKIAVHYAKASFGITDSPFPGYCQTMSSDPRCEKLQIAGANAIIDWGGSEGDHVFIEIPNDNDGVVYIDIKDYSSFQKSRVNGILSSFKFIK